IAWRRAGGSSAFLRLPPSKPSRCRLSAACRPALKRSDRDTLERSDAASFLWRIHGNRLGSGAASTDALRPEYRGPQRGDRHGTVSLARSAHSTDRVRPRAWTCGTGSLCPCPPATAESARLPWEDRRSSEQESGPDRWRDCVVDPPWRTSGAEKGSLPQRLSRPRRGAWRPWRGRVSGRGGGRSGYPNHQRASLRHCPLAFKPKAAKLQSSPLSVLRR